MLELAGHIDINRSAEDLWRLLLDPQILMRSIPECEELELISPGRYRVAFKVRAGFLRSRFAGEVELKDVVEHERCQLELTAKGTAGVVHGITKLWLLPAADGIRTRFSYESRAKASGMIAIVGSKWVQGSARAMVEQLIAEVSRL